MAWPGKTKTQLVCDQLGRGEETLTEGEYRNVNPIRTKKKGKEYYPFCQWCETTTCLKKTAKGEALTRKKHEKVT